jgi:glycosyltransferase involved in cell wall biosynthesis
MSVPFVSCVICCHNSAARLPETIKHLSRQRFSPETQWELLIVDNGSTDDTEAVVRREWAGPGSVALRIVKEPKAGLSHARVRALAEARGEIISFIDDDNWVCEDWVEKVARFMAAHPEVGGLGSYNIPVSNQPFPEWFTTHRRFFAVAGSDTVEGDITDTDRMLVGAGFSLRKAAADQIWKEGFRYSLAGRSGRAMSAGEDQELCLALQLSGWRLWFSRELTLQHFIPESRLKWSYLCALLRGIGRSSVMLDPYMALLKARRGETVHRHQRHWLWRAAASLRDFVVNRLRGETEHYERALGRLEMLCRIRGEYQARFQELSRMPWLQGGPP